MAAEEKGRKGDDFDVIPSLMDVLSEAMAERKRTAPELGPVLPKHKRTLNDYLQRKRMPIGENLDPLVAAVSALTDKDRFALWAAAVKRAEDTARRLGDDPRMLETEAALAAPPQESD